MWGYKISAGAMSQNGFARTERWYSGNGDCKNDPTKCGVHNHGPIPPGKYRFGQMFDDPHLGKHVMELFPLPGTDMLGRSGFYLHGENAAHPDQSSDGCPVEANGFNCRVAMNASQDRILEVIV